jgi:hypothetical protein
VDGTSSKGLPGVPDSWGNPQSWLFHESACHRLKGIVAEGMLRTTAFSLAVWRLHGNYRPKSTQVSCGSRERWSGVVGIVLGPAIASIEGATIEDHRAAVRRVLLAELEKVLNPYLDSD